MRQSVSCLILAVAVGVLSGCQRDTRPGEEQMEIFEEAEWDEDEDGQVEEDEMADALNQAGEYDRWDQDRNGTIDNSEFLDRMFVMWDDNEDGVISEREWRANVDLRFPGQTQKGLFSNWDTNGDNQIDENEFADRAHGWSIFENWDMDGDGRVVENEFIDGLFRLWDEDGDGVIDQVEWKDSVVRWFPEDEDPRFEEYKTFSGWDTDGNTEISADEFADQVGESNLFELWDADGDGQVGRGDFTTALFRMLDDDEDGHLPPDEWVEAIERWDPAYTSPEQFDAWDADGDGRLSAAEFRSRVDGMGLFEDWDADNNDEIDDNELAEGLFEVRDRDGDGVINEEEWQRTTDGE